MKSFSQRERVELVNAAFLIHVWDADRLRRFIVQRHNEGVVADVLPDLFVQLAVEISQVRGRLGNSLADAGQRKPLGELPLLRLGVC